MMSRYPIFLLLLIIGIACSTQKEEKWVSLFNGKDLTGWTVRIAGQPLGENYKNTFTVSDSVLHINYAEYDSFRNQFGALYYHEPLSNYRLRVVYRFVGETKVPGSPDWGYRDSGIQFHSQSPESMKKDQLFPVCLEYNLHGGNGVDARPVGEICANGIIVNIDGQPNTSHCTPAKVGKTFHGDDWVTLEIDVSGTHIEHFVNGEKIMEYDNPRYDSKHEIGKTFISEDSTVTSGYISLQSNSHPIDFKTIEIKKY